MRTSWRTLFSYAAISWTYSLNGSSWAGSLAFGWSRSSWMARRICFTVRLGRQSFSSLRIDRHTVPLGYTLG
eukprot:gene6243-gene4771